MTATLAPTDIDLRKMVADFRAAQTGARRAVATYASGGGNFATWRALDRHQTRAERIAAELIGLGTYGRALAGLLTQEQTLMDTIAERKANHAGYVELTQRLAWCRRDIKAELDGNA